MHLQNENRLWRGLSINTILLDTLLFALIFPLAAFGQPPETRLKERIHYGDVVDVDVVGSFDFDWRGGLTPEGFLDGMDKVTEPVYALCRTEGEVAASIREQYARILRNPNVVVRIIDRSNRALAYLNGAVRKPQRFQLRRSPSLTELIVLAGGITDSSSGEVTIFRPPNVNCTQDAAPNVSIASVQTSKTINIKISDLLSGAAEANPKILNGDIVNIVEAPPVFLVGGVAAPKRLNLTPNLTLTRAIAATGGIPKGSGARKARIFRRRGGVTSVLEFDIRSIQEAKADDPRLEPYDVVDVEERGKPPRKPAPVPDGSEQGRETLSKLPLRIVD